MEYWLKRLLEGQAKVADKTIEEIEQQLKKYYRHVMETTIADFEATYDKLLATTTAGQAPTPADLYKLDKYWKTQAQLKKVLQELGDKQIGLLSKRFEEVYGKVYSALALPSEEVFSTISQETTRQMINQIWCADGKSWSQRVWANTDRLQQSLNDGLIDCVVGGKKTSQLVKELRNDFQVSYYRANTIVKTEVAHIQTQASKERYKSYGVQEVEIFADPDNRTCPICSGLDGKKYNINEPLPLPAHPNCRCCILPVIEVEENLSSTKNSGIISGGRVSGALSPNDTRAGIHAEKYYESIRHMSTDVKRISKATGYSEEQIQEIKNYLFMDKHDLGDGRYCCFDPDFYIAESWQRLMSGKYEPHDITLIKHEIYEQELMAKGYTQDEAHRITSKIYNYAEEANKFYDKIKKHNK